MVAPSILSGETIVCVTLLMVLMKPLPPSRTLNVKTTNAVMAKMAHSLPAPPPSARRSFEDA
jgi:hypothetical protein